MNGLAIDTTTETCSVAVLDRHGSIRQRYAHAPRRHGELLLGWIEELLREADLRPAQLDGIWVTQGPGSFTSVRMGFGVATSLAFALDIPVITVSSLLALAARATELGTEHRENTSADGTALVLATLDARLGEVYAAWYHCQRTVGARTFTRQGAEQLLTPDALVWPQPAAGDSLLALGNGLLVASASLLERAREQGYQCHADCWPQARDLFALAELASGKPAWQVQLPYLRKKVAEKPASAT